MAYLLLNDNRNDVWPKHVLLFNNRRILLNEYLKFSGARGIAQYLPYSKSCSCLDHPWDLDSELFVGYPMMNSKLPLALMNAFEAV